ncbi:SNAP33 [Scenedesmus sp. PABB004]|nr:SNAP33 [Scenedesmus sp. PABB004]
MQYQPAPPSGQRMAYGAAPRPEQAARAELMAGAQPRGQPGAPGRDLGALDNRQLMDHAVETHKETTATSRRALQIVEQTKEIQATTQVALREQGQQMHRIESDMARIEDDLSYSERILRFMRLCCCFGFFCSCCTEPGPPKPKSRPSMRGPGPELAHCDSQAAAGRQQLSAAAQRAGAAGGGPQPGGGGAGAYPGVSTRGLEAAGFGEQAATIDGETAKQDRYLDEISRGLDQIKLGAQQMGSELRAQGAHAESIRADADALQGKLSTVNREGFRRI